MSIRRSQHQHRTRYQLRPSKSCITKYFNIATEKTRNCLIDNFTNITQLFGTSKPILNQLYVDKWRKTLLKIHQVNELLQHIYLLVAPEKISPTSPSLSRNADDDADRATKIMTIQIFVYAMRLTSHLLHLDTCTVLSERMTKTSPYVPRVGSTNRRKSNVLYGNSILTKCAKMLVHGAKMIYSPKRTHVMTILETLKKLTNLTVSTSPAGKTVLKYNNFAKLHKFVTTKLKRVHGARQNAFVTDRLTKDRDVNLCTSVVVPGVNYARKAALHNLVYYRMGEVNLCRVMGLCLSEQRKSAEYTTVAEMDMIELAVGTASSRLKVQPIVVNFPGCTCTAKCSGWDNRNVEDLFQENCAISGVQSIKVCRRCGLSPNTKNKKATRAQSRVNNMNTKCVCCSLDGSPAVDDLELYRLVVHEDGYYDYKHMFHSTNTVSLMEQLSNKTVGGPEMKLHGTCFGGWRKCYSPVKINIPSSNKLKGRAKEQDVDPLMNQSGRNVGKFSVVLTRGQIASWLTDNQLKNCGEHDNDGKMIYHADETVLMCKDCRCRVQFYKRHTDAVKTLTPKYTSSTTAHKRKSRGVQSTDATDVLSSSVKRRKKDESLIHLYEYQHTATPVHCVTVHAVAQSTQRVQLLSLPFDTTKIGSHVTDRDTCVEKVVNAVNFIFREATRSNRCIDVDRFVQAILKPKVCSGCIVRLRCKHVWQQISKDIEKHVVEPSPSTHNTSASRSASLAKQLMFYNVIFQLTQ